MKKLIITISFLLSTAAHAGIFGSSFLVEPYVGYNTENTKLTDLSNNLIEIKTASPNLGLKLGFRSMMGIDVNLFGELTQGKAQVTGLIDKNNFTKTASGVQLGVNSLGAVKMFLGATLSNDFKLAQSSLINETTFSGPSYHVGLLIRTLSYLNIGLQYTLNQYNKVKGANYTLGESTEKYYSKIDTQNYSIYLSSTF